MRVCVNISIHPFTFKSNASTRFQQWYCSVFGGSTYTVAKIRNAYSLCICQRAIYIYIYRACLRIHRALLHQQGLFCGDIGFFCRCIVLLCGYIRLFLWTHWAHLWNTHVERLLCAGVAPANEPYPPWLICGKRPLSANEPCYSCVICGRRPSSAKARSSMSDAELAATHCNSLQHTATRCNTLQQHTV